MTILAASSSGVFARVELDDLASSYLDTGASSTLYRVQIYFRLDGTVDVERNVNADLNDEEVYCVPSGQVANLSVRCTVNSGTMNLGDATGSWLALTSERSFGKSYLGSGGLDTETANITLELSFDGGTTVAASKTTAITVGSE